MERFEFEVGIGFLQKSIPSETEGIEMTCYEGEVKHCHSEQSEESFAHYKISPFSRNDRRGGFVYLIVT